MSCPASEPVDDAGTLAQRLDKWLWFARVAKSRTLAAAHVTDGHVRVNKLRVEKPAHAVRCGDVITATIARRVRVLKVLALGKRRGPASEAQQLYEELTPVVVAPHSPMVASTGNLGPSGSREPGAGRPTKRDRRQMDKLRGDGS